MFYILVYMLYSRSLAESNVTTDEVAVPGVDELFITVITLP